ncbi:TPM domain-containing protein [Candidatus Woesearchaeota archaeon]|nr:TPM domain-containing protein [Candidatus Woesearchaeota archaeon]
MKWTIYILLIILLSFPVLALDELTGFVNDEAEVISSGFEQSLNDALYDLKLNTSVEMAVATVRTTGEVPIEEYSIELAHNTLGEKEKDNGLLILLAVDDRAYRIEVGYGLEPTIPDALAGRIGREVMAPRFKEGNFEQGLLDGVKVISDILKGDESWETTGTGAQKTGFSGDMIRLGFWVFFVIILILGNVIAGYKHAKKKTKGKRKKGGRPDTGDFLAAWFIASMFGRGGRGRGGMGGSGGIGGFGGFGGGGFGGGGFSGRF